MALTRNFVLQVASAAKEAAYDTAAAIDQRINVNIGNIPQESVQVIDDSDKVGGSEEATDAVVFAQSASLDLGINRVKPFALGFVGAYGLGAVSSALADSGSAASSVKQHTCTPVDNDGSMNSFSFEAWKTASTKVKYSGGLLSSLSLSVNRGANRMVNLTAAVVASGTTASGGGAQTEPAETQLNAATAGIWLDDTALAAGKAVASARSQTLDPSTSDLASPTDIAASVRSVTWDFSNNVNIDDLYRVGGGNTLAVGQRSGRSQSLTLDFDYADDTYITALKSQTEYAFQMIVRGAAAAAVGDAGYYHGFNLIFPVMQLQNVEVADDSGTLVNRMTFTVMDDDGGTHKSVYFDVFNEQAAYMA
tara:strand:+ start:23384 stop:24475 length:1092 start_codon:yes stop_codon:yes gene_type:complete